VPPALLPHDIVLDLDGSWRRAPRFLVKVSCWQSHGRRPIIPADILALERMEAPRGGTLVKTRATNEGPSPVRPKGPAPSPGRVRPPSLGEILLLPLNDLARLDLGFKNLLCATGLPDTMDLDIRACLKELHAWAQHVKAETERNLHRFQRDPGDYENSEAYYRVLMLITVLQQDCGVRYDPDSIKSDLLLDSGEGFIHGLLQGQGGTCTNMPVLYATVGRKLGYPIYLCLAKGHIFCRWGTRDGRERFNIEATNLGLNTFPDDHYMEWPKKITPREVRLGFYLRNLDPDEEVGLFMETRGHCLKDRGHLLDAIVAYAHAHRLGPANPGHFANLMGALNEEIRLHAKGRLPNNYREWEDFNKIARPQPALNVLNDIFMRVDKKRPPFRPTRPIQGN